MNLQVVIATVDRTSLIELKTFKKEDVLTTQVDSCNFKYLKFGSRTWTPARGDEVVITDTDTGNKVFGGRIIDIDTVLNRNMTVEFDIKCKDYTTDLDSILVAQTYESKTIAYIIADLIPAGFTTTNVAGTLVVDKIVFNYEHVSDCIKDLAKLVNYDWYVDYDKDIHFFPKNTEASPFNVTDSSSEVVGGSLQIDKNNSQLKNLVYVRGGEYEGNSRTEEVVADGEGDVIKLGNKFSTKPTVTLDTGGGPAAQSIGVEFLEDFADGPYDALWDFNQKYLRFDSTPNAGDIIAATGTPLIPLIVQVEDSASKASYGEKDFLIVNKNLTDQTTARDRGAAELDAYKDGVTEGGFISYEDGLRSGQTIRINSTLLGVNELYLIRKVKMKMHTTTKAVYDVKLVSFKTIGVIEFLQNLLTEQNKKLEFNEDEVLVIGKTVNENIEVTEEVAQETQRQVYETVEVTEQVRNDPWGKGVITWVWGLHFPSNDSDQKRHFRWDRFTWA